MKNNPPRVALFVTCLVDAMRPQVGFAALALLEQVNCTVDVPMGQTCCGQPALNSGDQDGTRQIARQNIELLAGYDHVVVPSGSCAATIIKDYPDLFESDPAWHAKAVNLAGRTHELLSYMNDVWGWRPKGVDCAETATYHDSCSGLRSLNVQAQPRQMLAAVTGLEMRPLEGANVCCGFGGTFCVKYPDISNAIVGEKAAAINATGADLLLGGDLGCLMNMAGKLHRDGSKVRAFHAAEILAGMGNGPAIGEPA
ncbi:MAG: Fe-S oxidoreductase [Acidocella sp. 20-57-95]|nr:MAG: Fe-S oxidoreductase [Acidocella sp. 20-57-95]OYV62648.1 MAG: Fe-S oxidoreductase [Acidocella sp. 21-58-7]HQT63535.1 (Fe-S)-binding protein [Acidocella sp.]HQU03293.1 (Fe-S)-binding protein [Acidocella sp.]